MIMLNQSYIRKNVRKSIATTLIFVGIIISKIVN